MSGEQISIEIAGQALAGWTDARVSLSMEHVPNSFELRTTEKYPQNEGLIDIRPGQPCTINIGQDPVLAGAVDRYGAVVGPRGHEVMVRGSGKCADLVQCSAMIAGMQISGASALGVAQQVAAPFGVTVKSLSGPGPAIPQYNVTLQSTPFEIIEEICRYSALCVFEGQDGSLILSEVGTTSHSSGFSLGVNVEQASVELSMDSRYSEYNAVVMVVDRLSDLGEGGNAISRVVDPTVPRFRPMIIVSEQTFAGPELAAARASWECSRRYGRSQAVKLTVDSHRDSSGALWRPNSFVPLSLPSLKIDNVNWIIASVDFIKDGERGTVADIVAMPKEAFEPQPILLFPFDAQVFKALDDAAATRDPTNQKGP